MPKWFPRKDDETFTTPRTSDAIRDYIALHGSATPERIVTWKQEMYDTDPSTTRTLLYDLTERGSLERHERETQAYDGAHRGTVRGGRYSVADDSDNGAPDYDASAGE